MKCSFLERGRGLLKHLEGLGNIPEKHGIFKSTFQQRKNKFSLQNPFYLNIFCAWPPSCVTRTYTQLVTNLYLLFIHIHLLQKHSYESYRRLYHFGLNQFLADFIFIRWNSLYKYSIYAKWHKKWCSKTNF